jgi:N-acetylneuraminate synthase
MSRTVKVGGRSIGDGEPCYVIAEVGINHNGSLETARKLIDAAVEAGCDAVKFQKRTPELCVPPHQRNVMRETPWGTMTYMEYRSRVEFGANEYRAIDAYCKQKKITWLASAWDEPSVDFLELFGLPAYKIPSASVTDEGLLKHVAKTGRPVFLSTGMSSLDQIRTAVSILGKERLLIAHCTSTYPCSPEELNLSVIGTLRKEFDVPIGYSGHEVGLQTTCAAVAMGACFVERHITLDRAMWGSDQAASVEPGGWKRLVRDIRIIETARGDGVKRIYESEKPIMERLRRKS